MALSQRKNQQQQRSQQNQFGHHNNKNNRTKGPAPKAYVFHDINNYEDDNEADQQNQKDQHNISNNQISNNYAGDDTDFNSSCCDYQSDVFKEQPSQYLEDSNSKYQMMGNDQIMKDSALQGMLSMQECRSESDFKENLQGSAFQGGCYSSALSPRNINHNQYNSQLSSGLQQKRNESQQSLRINHINSALESQKKESRIQNKEGRYLQVYNSNQSNGNGVSQSLKNSCEHSVLSPNYRSQNNGTSTTNKNNKQPLYSMVPETINKNLNRGQQQEQNKPVVYQYETNKVLKTAPQNIHDDSTDYILSGQNTIQNNNQLSNANSYQNLTPQKHHPQPMSPSIRPIQSNNGGIVTMVNNSFQPAPYQQQQIQQQFDSRNFNQQVPSSIRTQNSGQKATVVYNEFKYYTSSADLNNTQNPSKYINIAPTNSNNNNNNTNNVGFNVQRKSDISASHISGQPATLQYELSPGNVQNMFDVSSPKQSVSNGQASFNGVNSGASIRANSIRKQIIFNTDRNHHTASISNQNYQLQLKQEASIQPQQSHNQDSNNNNQQDAQLKIKELQNYIEQLEYDLKESQDKNQDLKQRFKEKSFIQSFDHKNQNKKHISDTEDSLILSEKKSGRKNSIQTSQSNHRNSLTKQNQLTLPGSNSLIQNQNQCTSNLQTVQNTNSNTADAPQQRSSSIVDVKIRPIVNLKNYQQNSNGHIGQGISPEQQQQMRYSGSFAINNNNPHIQQQQHRRHIDQESSDNQLEYQVQDFNDYSASQMNQSNDNQNDVNQQQEQDSQMMGDNNNHMHMSEDECEGCERLKQLVFQAKEAIDDLKLEIEEWRDICSDRETELRQLHHRIYNDIMGVNKKIEFNEEVQTKEFDPAGPVTTADQRKIRNYIQHNKKRIRSRSKNTKNLIENGLSTQSQYNTKRQGGINVAQCIKKKSALKGVKDLASEDFEFFEAEDIGLQTSFDCIDKNYQQQTQDVNSEQLQTNVSIDSTSLIKKQSSTPGMLSQYTSNRKASSPDNKLQQNHQIYEALKTTQADEVNSQQQYLEELCTLRTKNQLQEQEICKMRSHMSLLTGQVEKFVGLMQKAKKKNNKKNNIMLDIEDIRQNHELISNIESYSILEKINEWKREEGLIDQNNNQDQDPLPSQIPRPLKLIQDIDLSELELFDNNSNNNNALKISKLNDISNYHQQNSHLNTNLNPQSNVNNSSVLQQSTTTLNYKQNNNHNNNNGNGNNMHSQQYQSQMNNAQEFLQMIKTEQENIKRQTDQKYKELQKQQQEYLNVLKGV